FKPAEDTPLCALRLVEILEEAGLPAGTVNIVFGLGPEAGEALVRHRGVAAVSFTGSVPTGRHIAELCGGMLKRCSLELGGKNAIVVMDDADVELAREDDLARGCFYRPTVFADVAPGMRIAQEEIFGPTTAVIPVGSLDEALEVANGTGYGLSLSLYTTDLRTGFRAINELEAG